jgi:hypothetical protein
VPAHHPGGGPEDSAFGVCAPGHDGSRAFSVAWSNHSAHLPTFVDAPNRERANAGR